jgi:hypothetical protein
MKEVFRGAWVLLRRNPIIILPPVVVAIASAAIEHALDVSGFASWGFFGNLDAQGAGAFWSFLATIVAVGIRILGALIAIAFAVGMAGAAWLHGRTSLGDGAAALRRDGVQAFLALVILFLIGLAAAALLVPTFGLSVFAYMIFLLYTMPAVVVGERSAADAVVESIQLAARNFGITLAVVVLIVVLAIAGGIIGDALGRVALLGEVIGWVLMEAVVAYAMLVIVGEYVKLAPPAGRTS